MRLTIEYLYSLHRYAVIGILPNGASTVIAGYATREAAERKMEALAND